MTMSDGRRPNDSAANDAKQMTINDRAANVTLYN